MGRLEVEEEYPARMGIEEFPENVILSNVLHSTTAIQERGQHSLSVVNDGLVFLRFGRSGGIIRHGMLLGYGRNNQGGVKVHQGLAERVEIRISPTNFEVLACR